MYRQTQRVLAILSTRRRIAKGGHHGVYSTTLGPRPHGLQTCGCDGGPAALKAPSATGPVAIAYPAAALQLAHRRGLSVPGAAVIRFHGLRHPAEMGKAKVEAGRVGVAMLWTQVGCFKWLSVTATEVSQKMPTHRSMADERSA
jgi:hypothetical protein